MASELFRMEGSTPLCHCLYEEILTVVGPFYLVSMPWELKDPTQGVGPKCYLVVDSTTLRDGQLKNNHV